MSSEIVYEARFMLEALCLGMILSALYDFIRIVRRVFPHGKALIGTEDFLYWMCNTYLIFRLLFKYNYGVIRWFAILGVIFGMLLYRAALGNRLVKLVSGCISKGLAWLSKPFQIIYKKVRQKRLKKPENDSKVSIKEERGAADCQ